MRARIYQVQRHGGAWFAYGVPCGLPRLRCTWALSEAEATLLQGYLRDGSDSLERDLGDPVRTVGVPERFAPTDGY